MLRDVLRITTAGSVDDGKSTLIAHLLLDTDSIPQDHISAALGPDSDPSRIADLLDGLESEKEQGITIDVAHRFFDSETRRYHLSDSPGHEQYTRNIAGADVVILVLDASAGIKPQTQRHLDIAYRLGVRHFIVVANKFDLVNYSSRVFTRIRGSVDELLSPVSRIGLDGNFASGTEGMAVVKRGPKMRWYRGPTILEALDKVEPRVSNEGASSLAVQLVQRLGNRRRHYFGTVLRGCCPRRNGTHYPSRKSKGHRLEA